MKPTDPMTMEIEALFDLPRERICRRDLTAVLKAWCTIHGVEMLPLDEMISERRGERHPKESDVAFDRRVWEFGWLSRYYRAWLNAVDNTLRER